MNIRSKISYFLLIIYALSSNYLFAQIGINTQLPRASLDVRANNDSYPDGIIAPILSKEEVNSRKEMYKSDQEGAIIYINNSNGETSAETENIRNPGYYYFDGVIWQRLSPNLERSTPWNVQGTDSTATANTENIYQTGSVNIGSSTKLNTSIKLGVEGNSHFSSLVNIGNNTTFNPSAQLNLSDNNKGLLINKVVLTSKDIKAPVNNAVEGMLVYNTTDQESNGLTSGFYYWYKDEWVKIQYKVPQSSAFNITNLQTSCTSIIQTANTTDKGTPINMGDITIRENGSYAFSFRLYGSIDQKPTTPATMVCYYISLLANGKLIDTSEMDIMPGVNVNVMTYSIVLAGTFKAGDVITFALSHNVSTNYPWTLKAINDNTKANRTSMVWWKLS